MTPGTLRKTKAAVLIAEVDSIYRDDTRFWSQTLRNRDSIAAYNRRQDRLQQIRREFSELFGANGNSYVGD
jgi:hypothetical protein